ncbi:GGDEF domain-containing protein [Ahrensia kielensis]|uniref:GGDEF domain-containing protein n=1 Tax=Ahrensia kielensis TaxID=76980 RepID=UPI0012E9EDDF|nr:GGDEF domain-containing protein [Ahrensia kielensis]
MSSQLYFQLITPLIFLVFAMGFGLIYRYTSDQDSARYFAISYLFGAIAFVLDICRSLIPGIIDNMVSNLAYMLSAGLFSVALMAHYRRKKPWAVLSIIGLVALCTSYYFMLIDDDMAVRALVLNFFGSLLLGYPVIALRGMKRRPIDRLIYWVVAFTVVQFQLRTIIVLMIEGSTLSEETYSGSLSAVTFQLLTSVSALLMALALFAMFGMEIVLKLRRNSETDILTGLLNRRGVEAKLPEFENALANGVKSHGVLVLDIDHFKEVNDTFGHSAGDEVLVACANLLKELKVEQSIVSRVGGEEFNVVLYNVDENTAKLVAEYACSAFSNLTHPAIDNKVVTVSIGVALWDVDASFAEATRKADTALYRAKSGGRNRVVVARTKIVQFQTRGAERRAS